MTTDPLEPALREGLAVLGLALPDAAVRQLLDYMAALERWNRVYNLTAVRAPAEMLTHHLLDSLAVVAPLRRHLGLPPVPAQAPEGLSAAPVRVLDVGSGGGLPGVVLAIACPDLQVTCVDAVAKKAAFVGQVAASLRLPHLRGVHARVESLKGPFDLICSRAFSSLTDFAVLSRAALAPHGVWMAMKGRVPHDEMAALPADVEVFHVEPLTVPGLDAERCLVWMRPVRAESP
ncbi:16S rRNA (guanine(527)-N(7))-methyltransferase [Tepidimonas fonticaldi]|uniref:Ribosomal RNA small subunit methyltransferase G n=1 Tax=Tepidimonas fonticaldi TaxID=1101373 RepID=A0A1A6DWL2_9BURK|nr:16S rRNA (guanine(527)-N(7))-methyltransferase RsmG [Tepidimonas fonticaldi]OBS31180.1 16S rRNA (guanine(527)-N(7))-methyltransferase [Tepidimonas fonticaldi]